MNLTLAKYIKKFAEDILPMLFFGACFIGVLGPIIVQTNGVALWVLLGILVLGGLVYGFIALYEKAVKTVKEVEEGDFDE